LPILLKLLMNPRFLMFHLNLKSLIVLTLLPLLRYPKYHLSQMYLMYR
jgi:hypothetical protein